MGWFIGFRARVACLRSGGTNAQQSAWLGLSMPLGGGGLLFGCVAGRSRPEARLSIRLSVIRSGGPVGEVFEEGEAGIDFLAGEVGEAVGGEGLAGKGGND